MVWGAMIGMRTTSPTIAYFVTQHGFGHACRAAAVMAAFERRIPQVRFELFTNCPAWIFEDSLENEFGYYDVKADVGIVQRSPLQEDLVATRQELAVWMPFAPEMIDQLAKRLDDSKCQLVICDISALGIAAAKRAGLPSVLVENFTWDFIYASYLDRFPELEEFSTLFKEIYSQVDLHIQTQPLCNATENSIQVGPIRRHPRTHPTEIRAQLQIPSQAQMVILSMGGVPDRFLFLDRLPETIEPYLVIPGADDLTTSHHKVLLLPTRSQFFHPDLIQAADLVIGKAGYSTVAETYQAGVPFAYLVRPTWPETPALEHFIKSHMSSCPIGIKEYNDGRWLDILPDLLQLPRSKQEIENGADTVARVLCETYFSG